MGIRFSFREILTGSDLSRRRLAQMAAFSGRPGPVVWLTGCAHGEEVGGIVVIQEVFRRLRRQPLCRGQVHAFPLMNPMGFEIAKRHIGVSGEDLNRCFPGNKNGSLAQRIASVIYTEIMKNRPTLALDLHNDWRNSVPYVVVDPPPPQTDAAYEATREYAQKTGLLLIAETPQSADAQMSVRTLSGSLLKEGVPAVSLELGEAYVVNETYVNCGVDAVWNVMASLEMVEPPPAPYEYPLPPPVRGRFLDYYDQLLSSTSGIIRFLVRPGDIVAPGEPVARIYNAFGKLQQTLASPHRGIVLGHSDSSVAFPGSPVVALGVIPAEEAQK